MAIDEYVGASSHGHGRDTRHGIVGVGDTLGHWLIEQSMFHNERSTFVYFEFLSQITDEKFIVTVLRIRGYISKENEEGF